MCCVLKELQILSGSLLDGAETEHGAALVAFVNVKGLTELFITLVFIAIYYLSVAPECLL